MRRASALALLFLASSSFAAPPISDELVGVALGEVPPGSCERNKTCQVSRVKATAPQGLVAAQCLVEGGTGQTGACLGGFPSASSMGALFLGIAPSSRSTSNYVIGSAGTNTQVNTPGGSVIALQVGAATQWTVSTAALQPNSDNTETLGTSSNAVSTVFTPAVTSSGSSRQLLLTSSMNAATATNANAAMRFLNAQFYDANDRMFEWASSNGVALHVDYEGDGAFAGTSLTVGGQEVVKTVLDTSHNSDHASMAAGTHNVFTISGLSGLTLGDFCQVSFDTASMPDGAIFACKVVSTTQVAITRHCASTSACDPPSSNYYVRVTKR